MPDTGKSRPVPAFVEDWDDDANTTISTSKATASVASRRNNYGGSDSGYSSKAATISSDPAGYRIAKDLRLNTTVLLERDRQPYQMSYQASPNLERQPSQRQQGTTNEPHSAKEHHFVHERGICTTCDTYGRHYENREMPRSSSMAPNHMYKPSKQISQPMPSSQQSIATAERRTSSKKLPTPLSIHPPAVFQPSYVATTPVYAYAVTPITPTGPYPYSPVFSSYSTPISAVPAYPDYSQPATYFDTRPTQPIRPSEPNWRSSTYGEPIIRYTSRDNDRRQPDGFDTQQATTSAYRSVRNAEQDRVDMPPPEKPSKQKGEVSRRPSVRKSATYNTAIVDHRRSSDDTHDCDDHRHYKSATYPALQPRPPPTSYRGPNNSDQVKRPSAQRHSVSYADAKSATKIATSSGHSQPLTRRTTVPTTSQELKELEAEAYQRDRSNMTSDELTAEMLLELTAKKRNVKSETGSSYSHHSHQSSSKGSSSKAKSHTSGHRTSIVMNNVLKLEIPDELVKDGRPISINVEGLTISLNSKEKDSEKHKEQKLLERSSSVRRTSSKKSTTNSSNSASQKGKERDDYKNSGSRRPSRSEDKASVASGKVVSRQPSRASSKARTSLDHSRPKQHYDDDDRKYE